MITEHEVNRQVIQQLWNQGIQNAMEIHNRTNIPLSTIYDNLKKLKNSGTIQRIEGSADQKRLQQMHQEH
jgi:sugar-specific transcriptional regulator TrmB